MTMNQKIVRVGVSTDSPRIAARRGASERLLGSAIGRAEPLGRGLVAFQGCSRFAQSAFRGGAFIGERGPTKLGPDHETFRGHGLLDAPGKVEGQLDGIIGGELDWVEVV
jgi:hypothetical protein